ncbi:MAG: hypothetical protein ACOH2C_21925 [Clostridium sp.]
MNKRKLFKKIIKCIRLMWVVVANAGLFLSCILIFRGIIHRNTVIVIFSMKMFLFFMLVLQLSNLFRNFLD